MNFVKVRLKRSLRAKLKGMVYGPEITKETKSEATSVYTDTIQWAQKPLQCLAILHCM